MTCGNCGETCYAWRMDSGGERCDRCGGVRPSGVPDAFFPGPYKDPHLIDMKNRSEKDGAWITSKKDKQRRMRMHNVVEKGDRVHGSR